MRQVRRLHKLLNIKNAIVLVTLTDLQLQLHKYLTKVNNTRKHIRKQNKGQHNRRLYTDKNPGWALQRSATVLLARAVLQGLYFCHCVNAFNSISDKVIYTGGAEEHCLISTFYTAASAIRPGRPFLPPGWRHEVCSQRTRGRGCSSSRTRRRSLS